MMREPDLPDEIEEVPPDLESVELPKTSILSDPKAWAPIAIRRRHIAICITGHGFGHAVRVLQVAKRLLEVEPSLTFTVITPVAEWFLRDVMPTPFRLIPTRIDIGTVQSDAIEADPLVTLKQYSDFVQNREVLFQKLTNDLGESPIDLVLVDLPPLGCELGAWLGVPTVAIGNFSWDWIYGEYTQTYPEYEWIVDEIRTQYSTTDLLLELPYAGDLSAFPNREEIPWICRRPHIDPEDVRKKLKIPPNKPIALVSFGGIGMKLKLPEGSLSDNIEFIVTAPLNGMIGKGRVIDNAQLAALGLTFTDVLGASSVVVSKPGYGIVSECIAAKVPMLYAGRQHFREYDLLVAGMKRHIRCELLSAEMLSSGNWQTAFESLFSHRTLASDPDPDIEGDTIAAEEIFKLLG